MAKHHHDPQQHSHQQDAQQHSTRRANPAPPTQPARHDPPRPGRARDIRAETQGTAIVVDGANIAYLATTPEGKPMVENILNVTQALEAKGFTPIVIVDAALYHHIDDPKALDRLVDNGVVQQAPAQTDADYFVLETAGRLGAQVVSDDQYKPYLGRYPWIPERRVPVMIVAGMVEFYEEKLEEPESAEGAAQIGQAQDRG